jgi:23S rRNA (adenine2503-C2)-methyltransferase
MLIALLGLNTEELRALVQEEGEPAYRGNQLAEWVYRRGARTFEEMTNLPDTLCVQLKKKYEVGRSQVVTVQHSRDGTAKLLVVMCDGAKVETVGLPYADRFSCCLSTQVGCPVGCIFCAT